MESGCVYPEKGNLYLGPGLLQDCFGKCPRTGCISPYSLSKEAPDHGQSSQDSGYGQELEQLGQSKEGS